jgi:hypothetical protein
MNKQINTELSFPGDFSPHLTIIKLKLFLKKKKNSFCYYLGMVSNFEDRRACPMLVESCDGSASLTGDTSSFHQPTTLVAPRLHG